MSIFSMYFLIGFFGGSLITLCFCDIIANYYPNLMLGWAIEKFKKKNKTDILVLDIKDLD